MNLHEEEILKTTWDAIVVGSGIGGATAAYQLAQLGKKVLIIEKGPNAQSDPSQLPLWRESVLDIQARKSFHPFLGECVGGSSRLYGMAMERLEASDFHSAGGRWPLSEIEWDIYFKQAESLFEVKPVPISNLFAPLMSQLSSQNLKPKPLNLSYAGLSNCDFCQGRICDKACKIDAFSGPLTKVLNNSNVRLLTDTAVKKIITNSNRADGVEIVINGQMKFVKAQKIYLALGALKTPYLLKNSEIGDSHGNLGRYLMRHFVDLYFLRWPGSTEVAKHKSIGISDFYVDSETGTKLGVFQSFGSLPPMKYVVAEMKEKFPWLNYLPGASFIIGKAAKNIFSTHVMASIIEDSPIKNNRLIFDDTDKVRIDYQISADDKKKIQRSRQIAKRIFFPFLKKIQAEAESNRRLAHACGTCRMGESIQESVVDWNCRVHELENLYIVDSSVFPSSSGKNPSLTIAANAIRVVTESNPTSIA